jgi:hypothetical protein
MQYIFKAMKKRYLLYLIVLFLLIRPVLSQGNQTALNASNQAPNVSEEEGFVPPENCDYLRVCMNWSQCFENNSKYRFCYDVNRCTENFKTIEHKECNHLYETHCLNGKKDLDETDVDCGGSCAPCALGQACKGDVDCESNACDMLDFECVSPREKTTKIGAFAKRRPFDFWLFSILGYLGLFLGAFFLIGRSFKFREHQFVMEMEKKKMQNSIDLFYLFLSKKDFRRAGLAYKLAIAIGEKISDFLPAQDLKDLEELREDYRKYVLNPEQEPSKPEEPEDEAQKE